MKKNNILYVKKNLWKIVHISEFNKIPPKISHIVKAVNHYGVYMETEDEIIVKPITSNNGLPSMVIKSIDNTYKKGYIAEYGLVYNKNENALKLKDIKKKKFSEESINEAFKQFYKTYNRDFNGYLKKHPSDEIIELDNNDKLD